MTKIYACLLALSLCTAFNYSMAQTIHEVGAINFAFTPNNLAVAVGDIIRFRFVSGFPHTTTSTAVPPGAAAWDSPLTTTVPVYDYVVTTPGTYTYICTPHAGAGMVGSFVVNAVAPVKMTELKASTVAANKVRITWKTATEANADHFTIESSMDGLHFTDAGQVAATGNSTSEINYAFNVTIPVVNAGQRYVYFRINTVDKDGKMQFSNVLLCKLQDADRDTKLISKLFPVPAQNGDHLNIHFNADITGSMQVTILDLTGRSLYNIPLHAEMGFNQTHIPLPVLKRSAYYLRFEFDGKKEIRQLVIQ